MSPENFIKTISTSIISTRLIKLENRKDNLEHHFRISRSCEFVTDIYIYIPYVNSNSTEYPFNLIETASILVNGEDFYERCGKSLFHQNAIDGLNDTYYQDMRNNKKGCIIKLCIKYPNNKPLILPTSMAYDISVIIKTTIPISQKYISINMDGAMLQNQERNTIIRINKSYYYEKWSSQMKDFKNVCSVEFDPKSYGLIYGIIYSAENDKGEIIVIKNFSITLEGHEYYSERDHMINFRMRERGKSIHRGIYEWKIDPNEGFNADRLNYLLKFEFDGIYSGTLHLHILSVSEFKTVNGCFNIPFE